MTQSLDLDINRAVRRILVKHWIDLGRISVQTTRGRVAIYGVLRRIQGRLEALTGPIVDEIFRDLESIKGVQFIRPHLDNWSNDGGRWHPCEPIRNTDDDDEPALTPATPPNNA